MQTACPWCNNALVFDDAKVPKHPFLTRCPTCQGKMELPGDGKPQCTATKHGPPTGGATTESPPPQQPAPPPQQAPSAGASPPAPDAERALVALEDQSLAAAMASLLQQQGYAVDGLDMWHEKVRLLHQGDYPVVVTSRAGPTLQDGKTIYLRMNQLSPESRRRTFLILIEEEFRPGDGTQAFVAAADLVAPPKAATDVVALLRGRIAERARVYQAFTDAEEYRRRSR